jgi:hypothetical protein
MSSKQLTYNEKTEALTVPIGAEIPRVCIHTGKQTDGEYIRCSLFPEQNSIYLLLAVISLLFCWPALIIYNFYKTKHVKFFISSEVLSKQRKQNKVLQIIFIFSILAIMFPFIFNQIISEFSIIPFMLGVLIFGIATIAWILFFRRRNRLILLSSTSDVLVIKVPQSIGVKMIDPRLQDITA